MKSESPTKLSFGDKVEITLIGVVTKDVDFSKRDLTSLGTPTLKNENYVVSILTKVEHGTTSLCFNKQDVEIKLLSGELKK